MEDSVKSPKIDENDALIFGQYVNQRGLMKHLHIGYSTLKELHLQGLESVQLGRHRYYKIEDVKRVIDQLKK